MEVFLIKFLFGIVDLVEALPDLVCAPIGMVDLIQDFQLLSVTKLSKRAKCSIFAVYQWYCSQ